MPETLTSRIYTALMSSKTRLGAKLLNDTHLFMRYMVISYNVFTYCLMSLSASRSTPHTASQGLATFPPHGQLPPRHLLRWS